MWQDKEVEKVNYIVQVDKLNFEYPTHRALIDVSFRIKENSITALVGPNGAGKTTLLKCLAALYRPFSGSIIIDGVDVIKDPRAGHEVVGFQSDFFGLYYSLTVRQSLQYFAEAYGMDKSEISDRIQHILGRLLLLDKADSKVITLSRGMRQRMAIAQSIIHQPKLLMLDEPASGLDPEKRHQLAELFKELNAQGMSLIVSSHILAELDEYASNLIILNNGEILEGKDRTAQPQDDTAIDIAINIAHEITLHEMGIIKDVCNKNPLVLNHNIVNNVLIIRFKGDLNDRHLLLKSLVNNSIAITEFKLKEEKLQDEYIELINKK